MKQRLLALITVLIAIGFLFSPVAQAAALVGPNWATKIVLYNASPADAVVLVVIQGKVHGGNAPAQDGCPSDIRYMRYVDLTANSTPQALTLFTNPSTGWFTLKRGHSAQVYSVSVNPNTKLQSYCIQGFNIGFQGQSAACPLVAMPFPNTTPGPQFNQDISAYPSHPAIAFPPNGVNGFEGSVNLTGLITNAGTTTYTPAPESVDITCLGGANSKMKMQITPPVGGPYWTYNSGPAAGGTLTYRTTANFQNSWVKIINGDTTKGCDDNCVDPKTGLARPGVFPYGCSICNAFPDPAPACGTKIAPATQNYASQFCGAKNLLPAPNPGQNGCQLNRSAVQGQLQKFGGTIQVTYVGPLSPPAVCP
ncbi:MAG: hypothetical protein KGS72_08435 [Cyanobacteria bacterium REEB67]|nr:hypothetical protein [Cyanobacteria bacterium REEB67]